jgi:3-oxoacyl-(acyl-carrier-protein) synthase
MVSQELPALLAQGHSRGKNLKKNRRVVITGVGPISSIGIGKKEFWGSIKNGRTNVQKEEFRINGELIESFYIHKVESFNINNFGIDKQSLNAIKDWKKGEEDIDLYYLLGAIKLAIDDSSIQYNEDYNNIGLIVGHGNPGLEQFWDKVFNVTYDLLGGDRNNSILKQDYFKKFFDEFVMSSYDLQTYMYLFHIAKTFSLHGHHLFLNNACSSGLYALESGAEVIKKGKSEIVIVASAGQSRIYKYLWFQKFGYPYAKDGKIKPFADNADGLVVGDGGVAFVLEELEHALSRNALIYGEYLGGDFASESWKVIMPSFNSTIYRDTIVNALQICHLKAGEIDLINPHGTGMSVVDQYEARALSSIFNVNPCPYLSAFKPYIGHCIGASALLETAILILSLKNDTIPATLNCDQVNPKFKINIVKRTQKKFLNYVMKTCCAIAGFDAVVIFKKYSL